MWKDIVFRLKKISEPGRVRRDSQRNLTFKRRRIESCPLDPVYNWSFAVGMTPQLNKLSKSAIFGKFNALKEIIWNLSLTHKKQEGKTKNKRRLSHLVQINIAFLYRFRPILTEVPLTATPLQQVTMTATVMSITLETKVQPLGIHQATIAMMYPK